MLKIAHLSVSYGQQTVLKNIDLTVNQGEILSIVGESGTGKTTLGLSIMGLFQEQSKNTKIEGEIHLKGIDITKLNNDEIRKIRRQRIAMVFQGV